MDKNYYKGLETSWETIANSQKPVFIYGMGDGCDKMLKIFDEKGIKADGIFASDDFVRGQSFAGYKVRKLSEVQGENFLCVLAFGTSLSEIMNRIDNLENSVELIAPDTSVTDDTYFEKSVLLDRFERAEKCFELMSDDLSRKTFENITAYKITGKLEYLRDVFSQPDKACEILGLSQNEIYCDLGAYTGDTVADFVKAVDGKYRKIYALEPDKHNFQKCVRNTISLDNIMLYNCAGWEKDTCLSFSNGAGRQAKLSDGGKTVYARSLDSILRGKECTYIKYDVEGADFNALDGSVNTIVKYKPKLCCALYHRPYDYIDIPLYINEICGGYEFFMRQYPYYPAWETNLFCKQRLVK